MSLSVSLPAQASWYLDTGGLSYHFGEEKIQATTANGSCNGPCQGDSYRPFNGYNPGIGLRYADDAHIFLGGEYLNSIEKTSYYLGAGLNLPFFQRGAFSVNYGLIVGIVSGYVSYPAPVALPFVTFGYSRAAVNFMAVPPIQGVTPAVLIASFSVRVD